MNNIGFGVSCISNGFSSSKSRHMSPYIENPFLIIVRAIIKNIPTKICCWKNLTKEVRSAEMYLSI
jgi:hypothetical protein